MSSSANSPNYSIHSIPAAYLLAFPPYLYQFYKGIMLSNYSTTNIVPRTNMDILKTKVSPSHYDKLLRARGCHLNALEGFPLFATAMVCASPYNYALCSVSQSHRLISFTHAC